MKIKNYILVTIALFAGVFAPAQMIQVNYNGTGLVYCNNPGQTEIGNAPTKAITWSGLQTFTGGVSFTSGNFNLGAATVTTLNGLTFTTGTGTLTLTGTKTVTFNSTSTFTGTDGQTYTFPTTSATLARIDAANTFTGASTATSWIENTPVITGGLTASGSGSNDFSASTGTFKTSTGAATFGSSTNTFTNGFAVAGGQVQSLLANYSTTSQSVSAASRTYITGSQIVVPAAKLQIGTIIRWRFNMTKTAAGSAASTIDIAIGTNGTTGDSAIVSFTKPAGTAAADEAYCEVECIVRGPLSASGIITGEFTLVHNLASTGHAVIPCVVVNTVSSTFDVTTAGLKVGLCLTSGASDVITIQQVTAQALNL